MSGIPLPHAGTLYFDTGSKLSFCIRGGIYGIKDMVNRTRHILLSHSAKLQDNYVVMASSHERRVALVDRGLTFVFVNDWTTSSTSVCVEGLGIRRTKEAVPPLCESEFLFFVDALDEIWEHNDRVVALAMSAHASAGEKSPLACLDQMLLRRIVDLVTVPVEEMKFFRKNFKKLEKKRMMDQFDYSADPADAFA